MLQNIERFDLMCSPWVMKLSVTRRTITDNFNVDDIIDKDNYLRDGS